jgi:hypothetical protein
MNQIRLGDGGPIYVVLAQRLDEAAVADSDAKGLQQQIAKHFADGTF